MSGYGKPFRGRMIARLTIEYGLKSRFDRLRARGMLTLDEMADRLGTHLCNDKNEARGDLLDRENRALLATSN